MSKSLFILGRQPEIGIAELESLFGSENIQPAGSSAAIVDMVPGEVNFSRIGGSLRLCKHLASLPFAGWSEISGYLAEHVPKNASHYGSGKLTLGISAYGLNVKPNQLNATALSIKKAVKKNGRSVRVVPNKSNELNSAQVLYNKLTNLPLGMELVLVRDGSKTHLAQTISVQDIDAYAARDQARPRRDAKVGMLPPKLAQIIVNLAVNNSIPGREKAVYDPFCGTGVILQEALLMGFTVFGADIEERMIDFASENLNWLAENTGLPFSGDDFSRSLSAADSTTHDWNINPDFIAAETYLGRPFSAEPSKEILNQVINDVNTIHKKFLQNVARQTKSGFRMCIAVPAWKTKSGFKHLYVLDSLEELGYTRLKFVHASWEDMIYHREGQIVGRELVVLKRI